MAGREPTSHDSILPQDIISAWPIAVPGRLRFTDAGTNNQSHVVDSPDGTYVLRIYRNTNDLDRIRYEHTLLRRLRLANLSFAVPEPLATHTGDTFVVAIDRGIPLVAALFPVIPGQVPQGGDAAVAMACGQALGELDAALARIAVEPTSTAPPWFGELDPSHERVRNPIAAIDQLPIVPGKRHVLRGLLNELTERAPALYAGLPHQIIHADFYPSNVLVRGSEVSGVLDFEFASPGLRAMDLAVGLGAFGISWRRPSDGWPLIDAFAGGYRRHIVLTKAEIAALPDLVRLREATSLAHWIERHGRGLTTEHDILCRVDRLLDVDTWLIDNGDHLIGLVTEAAR